MSWDDWLNPEAVIDAVSEVSSIPRERILGRGAQSHVSMARKIAVHLLLNRSRMSLHGIAHIMDKRDHTSILYLKKQALLLPPELVTIHTKKAEMLHRQYLPSSNDN